MKDKNCIFCKILEGEIPSKTIYEDKDFRVILDISPATRGHALIIPKQHVENLYELPDELAGKTMVLAKKLAVFMKEKLCCDGLNLIQNNGELAGQTVMHFHLHLIPRYESASNNDILMWNHIEISDQELEQITEELRFQP